jgi:hypothetical protein
MDKQQKHEWLRDFYTEAAKGGVIQVWAFSEVWIDESSGPNAESNPEHWRIKPELKVIDLTPLMWSGLDCEFWNDDQQTPTISSLISMDKEFLETKESYFFENCQPRMSPYIHYWKGESDKCPIPEGFEVVLHFRNGDPHECNGGRYSWNHKRRNSDIIGIEFIAVKDGYTLAAQ